MKIAYSSTPKTASIRSAKNHMPSTHFLLQRISALLLIPLTFWFCISLAMLADTSYQSIINWLQSPFNSIMMALIIIVGFKHAQLGMQTIIEDYISTPSTQKVSLFAIQIISYLMIILGVYSIITIALLPHINLA